MHLIYKFYDSLYCSTVRLQLGQIIGYALEKIEDDENGTKYYILKAKNKVVLKASIFLMTKNAFLDVK